MVDLQVLGHVHVDVNGAPVPLSAKGLALLTYLALEGQPQHREHLAALLWDRRDALVNLRVELARLRSRGLGVFPSRQPVLSLSCDTDAQKFFAARDDMPEHAVPDWLSLVRGLPLSGLDDLGPPGFQEWVQGQRLRLVERLEESLAQVHRRQLELGRERAAEQIRARAEALGLEPSWSLRPAAQAAFHVGRPEARLKLQGVLDRLRDGPRLLSLSGRYGSGKGAFVRDAVADGPWLLVSASASAGRRLLQAGLAQGLSPHLSGEARDTVDRLMLSTGDLDEDLVRLAGALVKAGRPVVLVIEHAQDRLADLRSMLPFLLGLPMPLLVVLMLREPGVHVGLRFGVERTHRLHLGPVEVPDLTRALQERWPDRPPEAARARAAGLVQQTDGWLLHVLARLDGGADAGPRSPLPPLVREALLAETDAWPERTRDVLAKLAMVYAAFDAAFASELLGEDVAETLAEAQRLGVLVHAPDEETVRLPDLAYRASDLEHRLGFRDEGLRIALAGSLTGAARADLRAKLSARFLATAPGLGAHYARRSGDERLLALAHARGPSGAGPWRSVRTAAARPAAEPLPTGGEGRAATTDNGYRLALAGGALEVFRWGRYGVPPLLRVVLPVEGAGRWRLVARVDVFGGGTELCSERLMHPLGVRSGAGARAVAVPAPHDFGFGTAERPDLLFEAPLGRWFEMEGRSEGGALELTARALDLALTVARFEWNGRPVDLG